MENNIPEKFDAFLGPYEAVEVDPAAKVPVGWGHKIMSNTEKMGEELWKELSAYGTQVFNPKLAQWSIVTKKLSDAEAIEQFGPISNVEYGPRGGYKSITFGTTTFTSKLFKR